MSDAILFDRHRVNHLDSLSDRPRRLRGSMLLWVDLHRGSEITSVEVVMVDLAVGPTRLRDG